MTRPNGNQQTLFQELTAAGCEIGNHESDLHVKLCYTSSSIIERYCLRVGNNHHVETFRSEVDGKLWFDIPFAYDPFWDGNAVLKPGT